MNTQVIFKIDKKLKEAAIKRARIEGVTLTTVLKSATRAFAEGDIGVGLLRKKQQEEKEIDRAMQVYRKEKSDGKLQPLRSLIDLE